MTDTMSAAVTIGIDPGQEGAIAAITPDGILTCDIDGSLVDGIRFLGQLTQDYLIQGVVIEKVNAMPRQGVSSSFKFGVTYGHLRGACIALGIPIIAEPVPRVWKKAIFGAGVTDGKEKAEQKRMARDKARELYPTTGDLLKRVKDADRAEALLLAHYGTMTR